MRRAIVTPLPGLDETLGNMARGQQAAMLHATLRAKVADREATWLKRLVSEFHAGTLTEPLMRSAVAGIAEGRALLDDLARTMRLGTEARHRAAQPPRDSRAGVQSA